MRAWAQRLARLGQVVTFDYPYMKAGRKSPDRLPVLLAAHEEALGEARARHGADRPVVLAGKSMGSRIGCHLAVKMTDAGDPNPPAALVCFGYPLRAGSSGALRDEVLRALKTPILFLQGSRDALCPPDDLARARAAMTALNALFLVEGGDHSLAVSAAARRASGKTQEEWDELALAAVSAFLQAHEIGGAR
jgi:predicted alpha/beta-hydrolase family hydrolase